MSRLDPAHASLSGLFPENTATPPVEGNDVVAEAISPGSPADPLEVRLVREILTDSDGISISPYEVSHLFDAASDMARGTSTREGGKTMFVDFDKHELSPNGPPELRKTYVELSIREALSFSQAFYEIKSFARFNVSFGFEVQRLVVKELAILLQEWDELTGQASSKGVGSNA